MTYEKELDTNDATITTCTTFFSFLERSKFAIVALDGKWEWQKYPRFLYLGGVPNIHGRRRRLGKRRTRFH